MNIPLSLLIYNPIEAYTIVLLCDIITGNNTKIYINDFWKLYLFGPINFIFQSVPNIWYGRQVYILINTIEVFVIHPIIIGVFYTKVFNKCITIRQMFITSYIQAIFVLIISCIVGLFFKGNIIFFNNDIVVEFIGNFLISSIQISLYTFIKIRRKYYEEYCKRNCRSNSR